MNDRASTAASAAAGESLAAEIRRLEGPILVLGASGFVGANLMRRLLTIRPDVYGTTSRLPAWRLEDLPSDRVHVVDLLIDSNVDSLLNRVRPRTVFNCVAFGAYSFETEGQLIYQTNFNFTTRLLDRLRQLSVAMYVHAGSSSEYGDHCSAPPRSRPLSPTRTTPSRRQLRLIWFITTASICGCHVRTCGSTRCSVRWRIRRG